MKLNEYIQKAKEYRIQGANASFRDLVVSESLCSYTRYEKFKVALNYVSLAQLEHYGVSAIIHLSYVKQVHRPELARLMEVEWKKTRLPLTRKQLKALVLRVNPSYSTSADKNLTRAKKLAKHVHRLEALLSKNGIKPPKLDEQRPEKEQTTLDACVALVRAKFALKMEYPSVSDADLFKIAMAQVENASSSLKQALQVRRRKETSQRQSALS